MSAALCLCAGRERLHDDQLARRTVDAHVRFVIQVGHRRGRVHLANFDDIHKLMELDTRLHNMEVCNGMTGMSTPLYGSMAPGMHEKPVTDSEHRRLLELEGLKVWMPPREEGYGSLKAALANPTP